ncbi:hypothetical protein ADILRU_1909 [Leifsonia rubra CMS 76R]|nr:hypothetical protein ADILRU_1909 [Leifsonia rubra CMS 76R]
MDATTKGEPNIDTIIFDFDGTVAIGAGPVLAYARQVANGLGSAGATLTEAVSEGVRRAEQRGYFPEGVLDGYGLVHELGVLAGATPEILDRAYHRSRTLLSTAHAPISPPAGLAAVLEQLATTNRVVLVTNAPDTHLQTALDVLGLHQHFDAVYSSAAKPAGLRQRAAAWLAEGRMLSVGDIWENDLAPVAELGGQTALVGIPSSDAHPDFASPTLPGLYPDILSWAELSLPLHSRLTSPPTAQRTPPITIKEHNLS